MDQTFARFSMLVGEEGIDILKKSSVIVFGVGGVGSYVVESLARCGVGHITMVDFDEISQSNINRQLHALQSTIGKSKVEVMKSRILEINPNCNVKTIKILAKNNFKEIFEIGNKKYDFVADCIDVIFCKINLIEYCYSNKIKIISSMGFGNKMYPEKVTIGNIMDTTCCPMARSMRNILRRKNIYDLSVVYTAEKPLKPNKSNLYKEELPTKFKENNEIPKKITPGSNAFVPGTAGLIMSAYIIRKLLNID